LNLTIYNIKEFKNFYKEISKKRRVSSSEEKEMFKRLDANGDGEISFNECKEKIL